MSGRPVAGSVGYVPLAPQQFAGLTHLASGKVRELFAVERGGRGAAGGAGDKVLLVASDRISAFDVVLPTEIPDKGAVLTALSLWWFEQLADIVPGHVLSSRVQDYPAELAAYADALRGRSMLCRRLDMVPVECVARGYLTGSGLADYRRTGSVSGHQLPAGPARRRPAARADLHAVHEGAAGRARREHHPRGRGGAHRPGAGQGDRAADPGRLRACRVGSAGGRGILLADTKLEFGHDSDGVLRLGDEVLTPDSSRFWPADAWQPGRSQPSFDKQYVRDWLAASDWDRRPPGPELPAHVVEQTRARYIEAYERLTGRSFDDYLRTA